MEIPKKIASYRNWGWQQTKTPGLPPSPSRR